MASQDNGEPFKSTHLLLIKGTDCVCLCVYDIHTQTHYTHKHGKKRGRRGVRAGGERASGESERKAEGT
jgi:hypothetical protein